MKAMILAAGLGTRLRPYTNDKPKALVEVGGQPLLHWAIEKLTRDGFTDIVVNVHHFGDQVIEFLERRTYVDVNIRISDERELLLNTGGGLKRALHYFDREPFLVYNTDVITNLDLAGLHRHHVESLAMVTLAVRKRESSRYLLFDSSLQLSGWRHVKTGELKICRPQEEWMELAFSGIHIIDPKIESYMPAQDVFSIIDVYLEAARSEKIIGYDHSQSFWMDVGRIRDLETARTEISRIFT